MGGRCLDAMDGWPLDVAGVDGWPLDDVVDGWLVDAAVHQVRRVVYVVEGPSV